MYHNVYICRNKNREIMTEYLELKDKANANFMQSKTRGDIRFHLLVLLALETGARVSDLLNITTENFSIENGNTYLSYLNKKGKKKQVQRISESTALKVDIVTNGISTYGVFFN
jgi:integrase